MKKLEQGNTCLEELKFALEINTEILSFTLLPWLKSIQAEKQSNSGVASLLYEGYYSDQREGVGEGAKIGKSII